MKRRTLGLIGTIAVVLIFGTVAFAVAVAAQAPRNSQIPTVVTSLPAVSTANTYVATPTSAPAPVASTISTKTPVVRPMSPQKNSGVAQKSRATPVSSQREVVTPRVRENGEGSPGDGSSSERTSQSRSGDSSSKGSDASRGSSSDSGASSH